MSIQMLTLFATYKGDDEVPSHMKDLVEFHIESMDDTYKFNSKLRLLGKAIEEGFTLVDAECELKDKLPIDIHMMILVNEEESKTLIIRGTDEYNYDGIIEKPSYAKKFEEIRKESADRTFEEMIRDAIKAEVDPNYNANPYIGNVVNPSVIKEAALIYGKGFTTISFENCKLSLSNGEQTATVLTGPWILSSKEEDDPAFIGGVEGVLKHLVVEEDEGLG